MELKYVLIGIFSVIVLYYMLTIAMDISNTTSSCEAIVFEANETLTPASHTLLLYPTPVLYQSDACEAELGNYTYEAGGYTIGHNESTDTYYGTYDYDTSATVWGLNLSWVAVLVTVVIGLYIGYSLITGKK